MTTQFEDDEAKEWNEDHDTYPEDDEDLGKDDEEAEEDVEGQ